MDLINENYHLKDLGYSNSDTTVEAPRHRWYFYKEGFSPNLVEQVIEISGLRKDDVILDPFNGSGTTTLTAALKGYRSIGIEVNPFTSYLSSAKLKNANLKKFKKHKAELLSSVEKGGKSNLIGFSTFSKSDKLDKWLFNDGVLNSFEGGWIYTSQIFSYNIRKLFRLALITAAMKNCNARRDGKCLRYRLSWKDYNFNKESFLKSLSAQLDQMIEDIEQYPLSQNATIINADSRKALNDSNKVESFSLCITSPPYLNTFDYTDIYRPELFLGKFVTNKQELYDLRLHTVRSHVQAKWTFPTLSDFGILYNETISQIKENRENLMHKYIPVMIQAYFEDMFNLLKLLRPKAKKNASLWIVVSNSAYAGIEVPVDLILGDVGSKAGWYLKEIGVLRYLKKRKSKYSSNITQLRESVIIFSSTK
ncbi:MAG: DNA methyltransferase [Thermodesulfobacteriota bacterium]|nr:DNA methyltransferase [Thermodesulfobacteriota bacterium]